MEYKPDSGKLLTEKEIELRRYFEGKITEAKRVVEARRDEEIREIFKEIERYKTKGSALSAHFKEYCILMTDIRFEALKAKYTKEGDDREEF